MADLSHWLAQACEYHDSEGTFKVIYFEDRQELTAVVEDLLRHGDSWSGDLWGSTMGSSNVYKSFKSAMPPDTGSWEPNILLSIPTPDGCIPVPTPDGYIPVPPSDSYIPVPPSDGRIPTHIPGGAAPVPAGDGLRRAIDKTFFHDFPGPSSSSAPPKDQDVLVFGGGNDIQPSKFIATNSSELNDRFQKVKEKEDIYYKKTQKSDKESVFQRFFSPLSKLFTKDGQVHAVKHPDQVEGRSPVLKTRPIDGGKWAEDPYDHAQTLGNYSKYALLFGISTEFNPSGIWVIEELYNDMQELDF